MDDSEDDLTSYQLRGSLSPLSSPLRPQFDDQSLALRLNLYVKKKSTIGITVIPPVVEYKPKKYHIPLPAGPFS